MVSSCLHNFKASQVNLYPGMAFSTMNKDTPSLGIIVAEGLGNFPKVVLTSSMEVAVILFLTSHHHLLHYGLYFPSICKTRGDNKKSEMNEIKSSAVHSTWTNDACKTYG